LSLAVSADGSTGFIHVSMPIISLTRLKWS
jgi:hypothetical protein